MPAAVQLTKEEIEQRGMRMWALLNDPLMQEAFEAIRADTFEKWLKTTDKQSGEREDLYWLLKSVDKLQDEMHRVIARGTASSLPKPADVV